MMLNNSQTTNQSPYAGTWKRQLRQDTTDPLQPSQPFLQDKSNMSTYY